MGTRAVIWVWLIKEEASRVLHAASNTTVHYQLPTFISRLPVRWHPHNTITRSIRLDEIYTNIIILTGLERWSQTGILPKNKQTNKKQKRKGKRRTRRCHFLWKTPHEERQLLERFLERCGVARFHWKKQKANPTTQALLRIGLGSSLAWIFYYEIFVHILTFKLT